MGESDGDNTRSQPNPVLQVTAITRLPQGTEEALTPNPFEVLVLDFYLQDLTDLDNNCFKVTVSVGF